MTQKSHWSNAPSGAIGGFLGELGECLGRRRIALERRLAQGIPLSGRPCLAPAIPAEERPLRTRPSCATSC